MDQPGSVVLVNHIIDITKCENGTSSSNHDEQMPRMDRDESAWQEVQSSSISDAPTHQNHGMSRANSNSSSSMRRTGGYIRHRRSPLNSGPWISVELAVTVGQIIAAFVVLTLSKHENPRVPLFAWVVGYASGCVATLPVLYWRYYNFIRNAEQEASESNYGAQSSPPSADRAISVAPVTDDDNQNQVIATNNQAIRGFSIRLNGLVAYVKAALDCFFAVWFIVGLVWMFGGNSSPSDAPHLYKLCLVFLIFSCIGYAMPFILCATVCCCLPCIVSVLDFQEDSSQTRGATMETINGLPTFKFKSKGNGKDQETVTRPAEGRILAAETEGEHEQSGKDTACCICLTEFADDDELRELPCRHFFHVSCVDTWLSINATCPLCKSEIGLS